MFHLKCRQLCITDMFSQIETLPVYLKQICIILIDPIIFLFQFRKSRKTDFLSLFLQQYLMSVITEHNTVFLRRFWVVFISIPVWCNILNHDFYLFFFYFLFFFFHSSTCIFICLRDTLLLKYPCGFHPRNVLLHNSFLFFVQTHGSLALAGAQRSYRAFVQGNQASLSRGDRPHRRPAGRRRGKIGP